MKKNLLFIFFFLVLFNFCIQNIDASNIKGKVLSSNNGGVRLRREANTTSEIVYDANDGTVFDILETINTSGTGCSSQKWYKVENKYDDKSSYVYACSDFVIIIEDNANPDFDMNACQTEMYNEGFPQSYWESLCSLRAKYPNWIFKADKTGLDWAEAVKSESTIGKKRIIRNGSNDGYLSTASSYYNWLTDTFTVVENPNWCIVNLETIAYYMDPRNWLNERYIFQFELATFDGDYQSLDAVKAILNGLDINSYSQTIYDAAINDNLKPKYLSPTYLASKIRQETGGNFSNYSLAGNSVTYNGVFYEQVYNPYNIGAFTGAGDGLVWAVKGTTYNRPWTSLEKSIIGGANFIYNEYVKVGQDTHYFQNINVSSESSNKYNHQYMTNIADSVSSSNITYNAYNKQTMINSSSSFTFKIPVFQSMPVSTSLPNPNNPNNYLSSLKVNGTSVIDFNGGTTSYTVFVPSNTTSINIDAIALTASKGASVSGTGKISINSNNQLAPVIVKAANGDTRVYNINVIKTDSAVMTIEETISNIKSGLVVDNYISGLTNVDNLISAVKNSNPIASVYVTDLNGAIVNDGNVGTGYKLNITANNKVKVLDIVIYGDTNGDGDTTILDLLRVQKYLLKSLSLSGAQYKAMDVSKDGQVDILDLLRIQKYLLGSSEIIQ